MKDPFLEEPANPIKDKQTPEEPRPEPDSFDLLFILWNEAKTIEGVIKSFWDDANNPLYKNLFIGIDRKTSDKTREIIEPFATHIIEFDFDDDFSKSRNKVIQYYEDNSDSEWAIMPDGHEFLSPESRNLLKLIMYDGKISFKDTKLIVPYFGMFEDTYCCNAMCSKLNVPEFLFQRPIIFKRGKNMKFKKAIHNYLDAPYPYKQILYNLNFEHRMPPDRLQKRVIQRKDMNIKGLKKNYKVNKLDTHALFYLGQTYADQGDYKEAVKWYKKHIKACTNNDELVESRLTCGVLLNNLKQYQAAKVIMLPALSCRPGWKRGELYYQMGKSAFQLGKYDESIHWLSICADMEFPITTFFIRPMWYGVDCYDALMDCHFKVGNYREALKWAYKVKHIKNDCKTMDKNIKTIQEIVSKGEQQAVTESSEIFQTTDIDVNG